MKNLQHGSNQKISWWSSDHNKRLWHTACWQKCQVDITSIYSWFTTFPAFFYSRCKTAHNIMVDLTQLSFISSSTESGTTWVSFQSTHWCSIFEMEGPGSHLGFPCGTPVGEKRLLNSCKTTLISWLLIFFCANNYLTGQKGWILIFLCGRSRFQLGQWSKPLCPVPPLCAWIACFVKIRTVSNNLLLCCSFTTSLKITGQRNRIVE